MRSSTGWRRWAGALAPLLVVSALPWGLWAVARGGVPKHPSVDPPLRGRALQRHRVLERIPGDPSVLVNVRLEHLPSTPDMTLLGKKALPALKRGLTNNVNAVVRRRIASVLIALADHKAAGALTSALKDWDRGVRVQAVSALAVIGDLGSAGPLLRMVNDPEESVWLQAEAVRALGWVGAKSAAPRLLKLLEDEKANRALRHASLSSLWDLRHNIPAARVRRALVIALGSDDAWMKTFAAAGAAELRDGSAGLRKALIGSIRDRNADVRNLAVFALGEIGHKGSIPPLRKRLESARSARLLNNITFALRKMGDPKVLSLLGRLLGHRLAVIRLNAAFVLGDIGDPEAVGLLAGALKDPSDFVRASAVAALGRLGHKGAIAHLEPLLTTGNLSLRQEVIFALNRITGGGYNDRIVKELLWHPHTAVRRRAAMELARRKDARSIDPLLLCLVRRQCSPRSVAVALDDVPSWRATGTLLVSYAQRFGSYGATSLLRALGKRKLKPGHRQFLRNLLVQSRYNPYQRRSIIRMLGRLKDKAARQAYWANLKTRDRLSRLNAAYALANQGYPQGRKVLQVALTQAAPRVKRGVADLIRSLNHEGSRGVMKARLQAALSGHGPHTTLAASYALTGWDPGDGIRRLVAALDSPKRRVRNEAAYYLMRDELRPHRELIRDALKRARTVPVKGTLRRILREQTPGALKAEVLNRVNL